MKPNHARVAPPARRRARPTTGAHDHLPPMSLVARAVLLALAALVAACGGDDDDTDAAAPPPAASGSVQVTASLGAVFNADVTVTCAATGTVLGTASSGATGTVGVATYGACAGPVLVSVSGRGDGSSTYFDEALAAAAPLPAGAQVRALAPALADTMTVGVTALTEVAAAQALAAAGSLAAVTAGQVNAANASVVTQVLGAGVTLDILGAPTPWTAATAAGSLGTSAADRYAYYLGALARMGQGSGASPALAVAAALAADLADGTLNGSTTGFIYTSGNLAGQLGTALSAMASFASPALQSAINVTPPPPLAVGTFSPASGAAGATITINGSGFDPDPFHMQVKFADNLAAEVVSSSATQVVVKVPAGAVTGPVTVTHILTGASVSSGSAFTVTSSGGGGAATWVSRASPSGFLLNGLAYGAGRFVAVGFGKTIVTSVDGLSWTAATAPDNDYYEARSVVWSGSQFVMVGDKNFGSSAPPLIATSPDGLAWTRRSWTPTQDPDTLADVAASGNRLTVVGLNGSLASSSDGGLTWVNETGGAGTSFSGVADSGSVRVAVGRDGSYAGRVLVNSGAGWLAVTSGLGNFYPNRVTWSGSRFVAVGAGGIGGQAVVATSADGATWTRVDIPTLVVPANFKLVAVAQVGGVLYAAGDNASTKHVIVRSEDQGATWTQAYSATTTGNAMLAGIAASADRVVTVGGVKSVTLP